VIPSLRYLTDSSYDSAHRYFVDGSPMTGDVDVNSVVQDPSETGYSATAKPDWRTVLVGSLGAGGKGYFVLDVTSPDKEFSVGSAGDLVKVDRTSSILQVGSN